MTSLAETTAAAVPTVTGLARARTTVAAYVALTKPRIIELLLVTTVPTMVLAARGWPGWGLTAATLAGGSLAAGSANALNCWWDRDIDVVMNRTARRPLARHTVTPTAALVFGLVLGVLATAELWLTTNGLSALLAVAAIAFYVCVYTMLLKRRTSQNIVWGGAAGCMPVLIGWSAVTNGLSWAALVLFAVIFFWTPPHFWALAMRFKDDYARASVPMLPVVATPQTVARRVVWYSWAMVLTSGLLALDATGPVYLASAVVLGGLFLREAHVLERQVRAGGAFHPMRLFHFSITYLALLFLAVALDQLL
ncbi:MAG: protoheme farnesyltransferase [Frankiales bacterium]|nr:protoheme farnesyltransferase [Frankiales bacterium]MCW2709329.1 protoheme farnesyltransferase [Frankiales bacterium]